MGGDGRWPLGLDFPDVVSIRCLRDFSFDYHQKWPRTALAWNTQLPTGMTLTVVTLLAFGGIWVVGDRVMLRQVHALVQTTERVAAGDLSARTGVPYHLSELGQLAHAFDVMAE